MRRSPSRRAAAPQLQPVARPTPSAASVVAAPSSSACRRPRPGSTAAGAASLGMQRRLHVGRGPGRASVEHDRGAVDLHLELEGGRRAAAVGRTRGDNGGSRLERRLHHANAEQAEEAEEHESKPRESVGFVGLEALGRGGAGEGPVGDLARGAHVVAEVVGARLRGRHWRLGQPPASGSRASRPRQKFACYGCKPRTHLHIEYSCLTRDDETQITLKP